MTVSTDPYQFPVMRVELSKDVSSSINDFLEAGKKLPSTFHRVTEIVKAANKINKIKPSPTDNSSKNSRRCREPDRSIICLSFMVVGV